MCLSTPPDGSVGWVNVSTLLCLSTGTGQTCLTVILNSSYLKQDSTGRGSVLTRGTYFEIKGPLTDAT